MTKDDRVETYTEMLRRLAGEAPRPYASVSLSAGDALIIAFDLESLSTELQELREALESFDDEVQSTSSHYRIGWQDAVRAMRRAALSHQGKQETHGDH
jgi:hypothetical protein